MDNSNILGKMAGYAQHTDKGPNEHNFVELYERFFFQWKDKPIKIFEIGILEGESLCMWANYFRNASVYGMDITDNSRLDGGRIKTIVGDQGMRDNMERAAVIVGDDINILIEDGSHLMEHQQSTLGQLFPSIAPGGYYVIEDVHTSLEEGFFDVESGYVNSTLVMLAGFMVGKPPRIASRYMLVDEAAYLDENIEFINLFYRNRGASCGMTAIIKKRLASVPVCPEFKPFAYDEKERGATSSYKK